MKHRRVEWSHMYKKICAHLTFMNRDGYTYLFYQKSPIFNQTRSIYNQKSCEAKRSWVEPYLQKKKMFVHLTFMNRDGYTYFFYQKSPIFNQTRSTYNQECCEAKKSWVESYLQKKGCLYISLSGIVMGIHMKRDPEKKCVYTFFFFKKKNYEKKYVSFGWVSREASLSLKVRCVHTFLLIVCRSLLIEYGALLIKEICIPQKYVYTERCVSLEHVLLMSGVISTQRCVYMWKETCIHISFLESLERRDSSVSLFVEYREMSLCRTHSFDEWCHLYKDLWVHLAFKNRDGYTYSQLHSECHLISISSPISISLVSFQRNVAKET